MTPTRRVLLLLAGAATAFGRRAAAAPSAAASADGAADLARAAARTADILGKPPRIAPLAPAEIPKQVWDEMAGLYSGVGLPPPTRLDALHATLARSPELMRAHMELAVYLFRGKLPVRDRELAILRTAWLTRTPFEWGEHVKVIKRLAGGTTAEIERIRVGSTAPGWSDHERAVLRGAEELHANAMIGDATWAELARSWDDAQLLEFPILVGKYTSVAFLLNSLRTRLEPDNPGLTAS
jgi:alkylhydroperoxidase family enzyme